MKATKIKYALTCAFFLVMFTTMLAAQEEASQEIYIYDADLESWLIDTNNDGVTDAAEVNGVRIPAEELGGGIQKVGFPQTTCRSGFRTINRLCIDYVHSAQRFEDAVVTCRNRRARICSYEDLSYIYRTSSLDSSYNPNGRFIGNMVGDDEVFCGNRSVYQDNKHIDNFEKTCYKSDRRQYWCCHDRE